jgi:hypothetical protein
MNPILLLLALSTTPTVALPPEVAAFVADRDVCEHFRGEPIEGDFPEQIARRAFVQESLEIHCAGTDRRLAALKKRYAGNAAVMSALGGYEQGIEGPGCGA